MRTLFWKIFAWFGAAQLLIAISLYLFALASQRGFDRGRLSDAGAFLEYRTRAAAAAYEAGGQNALRWAWRGSPRRRGRGWGRFAPRNTPTPKGTSSTASAPAPSNANNNNGAPPFGEGPPRSEWSPMGGPGGPSLAGPNGPPSGPSPEEERRGASLFIWKKDAPLLLIGPSLSTGGKTAVKTAFEAGTASYDSGNDEDLSFIARRVQTPSGARYVGIQPMPLRGRGFGPLSEWQRLDPPMLARFGVIVLLMFGFCLFLARYLSAPAGKLSMATHQFAAGDLSTRVGPLMGRRRDELADLGRDFDAMAERIEELVKAQNRLLADISHELRTPLARLNVAVELATDTAEGITCNYLDRIKEESAELDTMIGQLLTLQRLEARQTEILKVPFRLDEMVAQIVEDVDFEARAHGAKIEIKRLDACPFNGNAELLRSAIQNITRNAILHSGQPRVEVSLEKEDFFVLLCVRDYGVGVPEKELPKLFEPFYRVATDRARQSGGTGLGLSITKRAVEAHDGTVEATNAEGGGLRVEIHLPLLGEPSNSTSARQEPVLFG